MADKSPIPGSRLEGVFSKKKKANQSGDMSHDPQSHESQSHDIPRHDIQSPDTGLVTHESDTHDIQNHEFQSHDIQTHDIENPGIGLTTHESDNRDIQTHELQIRDIQSQDASIVNHESDIHDSGNMKQETGVMSIDPKILEWAVTKGCGDPRISGYSEFVMSMLRYLRKTTPEFSMSGAASSLLEDALSQKYPELSKRVAEELETRK